MPAANELLVLTRPAEALAADDCSAVVVPLPLLDVAIAELDPALIAALASARQCDLQIVLSAQAVRALADLAPAHVQESAPGCRWLAIGAATAAALKQRFGVAAQCPPAGARDSEGLLELLGSVRNERVAILTAPDGRDWLPAALTSRGATVQVVHLYRRIPRRPTEAELAPLQTLCERLVFSATSVALLEQLRTLLPRMGLTEDRTPVVVAAARIADVARTWGFRDVRVAESAAVPALLATLR